MKLFFVYRGIGTRSAKGSIVWNGEDQAKLSKPAANRVCTMVRLPV